MPRHWSQKRKYLQGKRGIEKPPFKLPDFIEATGAALAGGAAYCEGWGIYHIAQVNSVSLVALEVIAAIS